MWVLLACTTTEPVVAPATHGVPTPGHLEVPLAADVDVLVIGGGPAGLIAAREAYEQGASVLVVELSETAGGGGHHAARFFAAEDPGAALYDWPSFTGAVPDAVVEAFVTDSFEVVEDLRQRYGLEFGPPQADPDAGPRVLPLQHDGGAPQTSEALLSEPIEVWTSTRAVGLLTRGDRVVGARLDRSGDVEDVLASGTIVATGGFARDLERVRADRPALADANLVAEHLHTTLGLGHDLLEATGAGWQNAGNQGVHTNALEDPEHDGEALFTAGLGAGLLVDDLGERPLNEDALSSLAASHELTDGVQRLLWVLPGERAEDVAGSRPGYNEPAFQVYDVDALVEAGTLTWHDTPAEAEAAWGHPLVEPMAAYDVLARQGDSQHGKQSGLLVPFDDEPFLVGEVVLGSTKSFAGVPLDEDGRVLDVDGAPIPGLYAAGEVAGMLGTEAVGRGFGGSITAVLWSGRRAGRTAAEEAP